MPEGASCKRSQASSEAGLLAARGDSQVDIVAQPLVRVDVPVPEVCPRVLCRLNAPGRDVLQPIPGHLPRDGIDAVVAQPGQDARALRHRPHAIVLAACRKPDHVQDEEAVEEAVVHICRPRYGSRAVHARQVEEEYNPGQAAGQLPHGGRRAARDLALPPRRRLLGRVYLCRDCEHCRVQPSPVVDIVKGRSDEQAREEEDVAGVVEQARQLSQPAVSLVIGELVLGQYAIGHVPAEGAEFHNHHHLRARDVNHAGIVGGLACDVVDAHVAHQEDEANPWHVWRATEGLGDGVGAARRDRDGAQPAP